MVLEKAQRMGSGPSKSLSWRGEEVPTTSAGREGGGNVYLEGLYRSKDVASKPARTDRGEVRREAEELGK